MKKRIEEIVREFIPHKDNQYIPDLVKALTDYFIEKGNESFNSGCAFESERKL